MWNITGQLELTSESGNITDLMCTEITELFDNSSANDTAGKLLLSTGKNQTAM